MNTWYSCRHPWTGQNRVGPVCVHSHAGVTRGLLSAPSWRKWPWGAGRGECGAPENPERSWGLRASKPWDPRLQTFFFLILRQSEHAEILNKQDKELFSLNHVKVSCLPDASLSLDTLGCHPGEHDATTQPRTRRSIPVTSRALGCPGITACHSDALFRRTPFRNLCCTQLLCLFEFISAQKVPPSSLYFCGLDVGGCPPHPARGLTP